MRATASVGPQKKFRFETVYLTGKLTVAFSGNQYARGTMVAKRRLLGLAIIGTGIIAAFVTGALVFGGLISIEDAITAIKWCVFISVAGFVLHMFAVMQQLKEKRQRSKE